LYGDKEIGQVAGTFDAPYYYTSAKTGAQVEEVFRRLGSMIFAQAGKPLDA
jgi:hypothetical protein